MGRTLLLALSVLPYLTLIAIDAWMHERARQVPLFEQILHAGLAVSIGGFLLAVFLAKTSIALIALIVASVLMVWDELGYHQGLSRRERFVHLAAFIALLVFIGVWRWTELA